MDRRELLQLGTATLAATALVRTAFTQSAPAGAPATPRKPDGKFPLDVYSRSLQWLRTPQDVGKAVVDIGLQSVDLTVTPYPGHVDPTKVKADLPTFVNGLKASGVIVSAI